MNLKDIDINKIIRENIERLIMEESSVSDEVLVASEVILNHFLRGNYNTEYAFNELPTLKIKGTPINVRTPNEMVNGKYDNINKFIEIYIPFFEGTLCKESTKMVIQHELEHAYQTMLKEDNGDYRNKYMVIYNQAINKFNEPDSDYFDKELARYFYCCSNMEQDAFVNELYVELSGKRPITSQEGYNIIRNSSAFKAYRTIVDVKEEIQDPEGHGEYRRAFDKYEERKPYRWLVQLGVNAEARIKSKIRNVVKRARNEAYGNIPFKHINLDAVFN